MGEGGRDETDECETDRMCRIPVRSPPLAVSTML